MNCNLFVFRYNKKVTDGFPSVYLHYGIKTMIESDLI